MPSIEPLGSVIAVTYASRAMGEGEKGTGPRVPAPRCLLCGSTGRGSRPVEPFFVELRLTMQTDPEIVRRE